MRFLATTLLFSIPVLLTAVSNTDSADERIREAIRHQIESAVSLPGLEIDGEPVYSSVVLPVFYAERSFRPAWVDAFEISAAADSLIAAIRSSELDGLNPYDYHLQRIEAAVRNIKGRYLPGDLAGHSELADIDLLLTDAFLVLASHLYGGRLNPETLDPEWHPGRRDGDFASLLEHAITENTVFETLTSLLPNHPEYHRLRESLNRYRRIEREGGWPLVTEGPTLRKGDSGERIRLLCDRLIKAGDLHPDDVSDEFQFDNALESAVVRFQRRHGLDADGLVGRETLYQLNTPVDRRIMQVLINLERWRWLPEDLGERYIIVNIANFELDVIAGGEVVMNMRVIVGRNFRRTPVFTGTMTYLVFSPFWHIPPGITANDVLPAVQRDVEYLSQHNIRVFEGWGANAREVDPEGVDWTQLTARTNPYRFRQDPGPNNSLGRVKFMFPNRFNVYLHDTPARELFLRVQRNFSSGCIRIEKPLELAEYLLADRSEWDRYSIESAMDRGIERTVSLNRPIPVHLLYWTAWADGDGTIHFRRDVYNRDQRLYDALDVSPPLLSAGDSAQAPR